MSLGIFDEWISLNNLWEVCEVIEIYTAMRWYLRAYPACHTEVMLSKDGQKCPK